MAEPWLSGPVDGVDPHLQPVAHALLQAREDAARAVDGLRPEHLWVMPGGAASVGFHLRHIAGATERLLAYARGEPLTDEQVAAARAEASPGPEQDAGVLLARAQAALDTALAQVRSTDGSTLLERREVGRAKLPSTVLGLLFHAAEHAQRHVGQLIATAKALRAESAPPRRP
jgi:uncharacterized damage-inducible protein DinB